MAVIATAQSEWTEGYLQKWSISQTHRPQSKEEKTVICWNPKLQILERKYSFKYIGQFFFKFLFSIVFGGKGNEMLPA